VSFRYGAGINKPGFNPLATQTSTIYYELFSWGSNGAGQLGLNNRTSYSSPKQVGSFSGSVSWASISAGSSFNAAIKTDGTLWAWGAGTTGQLGLGNTTAYSSPKQVGSLTNWLQISAGYYNNAAIKTDGTLWAWGRNDYGQLGDGTTVNKSSPVQIGALTTWASVSTSNGSLSKAAIKTDGTLWVWGRGSNGVLGLGNLTNYSSPKQVGALTNWSTVQLNGATVVAIKTDGTLWSWGYNQNGQLGSGTTTSRSSPVQVGALTNWSKIANGDNNIIAVKTDGTLWTWGGNGNGQLGLNNTTAYSSPKQVGALTNWSLVSMCGNGFSLAIKTDGTLWVWGSNDAGQLGLNNLTSYSSPKQVGVSTSWSKISAGYDPYGNTGSIGLS